jgi:hypothetical protein
MAPRILLAAIPLAIVLLSCSDSKKGNDRDTMTKRQRDSVFGQSGIPNASAVTKAQVAADSIAAQRKRLDSAMAKPDTTG